MTEPATTPPRHHTIPATRRRIPCDHDPRTDAITRQVAPHLWDLAHHDDAKPGHHDAYADVLWTTALALHHAAEYDATHTPTPPPTPPAPRRSQHAGEIIDGPDAFGPDDWVELHAEFLESRHQYLAAGLLRELTVAPARAADGTLVGDPPTGTLAAVGRVVPFRR